MGPDLWELFEYGKEDDEVAAIIRLAHHSALPKSVRVVTQFGEIVTVRLRRGDLLTVSGASEVVSMSAGDTYHGPDVELEMDTELSSDTVLPTDERRAKDRSANGKGVVVGVVDWGFDFAHPDFRKEGGTSRIVALWDQRGGKRPNSPQPFGYGVVHDREAINKALREKDPYKALGYHPADADTGIGSHGTHVASIAAGTGGTDRPGGIANDADLVLVHNAPWDELESGKLGDSVTLLEAIDYISRTAGDRPWVINLSMGRHGEQHDGSTLIEQGLDAALRASPGRAVCMSAGNYFNKRVHASGQLRPTQERTFIWQINEGHPSDYNQLEIWYSWQDKFECSARSPDGSIAATVKVGERAKLKVGGKEVGNVYHRAQEPNNLDNHITIYLYKEAPSGEWEVSIVGSDVIDGRFHAWIEREVACPKCQSRFRAEDANPHSTTGTICNGRRTIAVGAYNAHDAETRLGAFSSVGPTRDGRLKPDLCAPGVSVLAARSAPREASAGLLTRMSGTSMAAPHVTGTVALMFQAAPRRLRIEETHNLLLENAKRVSVQEEIPDRIGIGFLDVDEAVEAARNVARGTPAFKEIVPTSAPKKAKAVAAGKESAQQEVAVEGESKEAFPPKATTALVEAGVLQSAIDIQAAQSETSESDSVVPAARSCGCAHASTQSPAASERESIPETESIGIPAERAPRVTSASESTPETEGIGIPAERAPRVGTGATEAETEAVTQVESEAIGEDLFPEGLDCSATPVDCLFPPASDLAKVRPKGSPEGEFIDRTEGDPAVNLALQLTDYDVNAYLPNKARHAEALGRIRDFIVNRSVQTSQNIAVTVTGLASRTGGKAYNDALSCKRARCAAENLRLSLETFRDVMERVKINSNGDGFTRATCDGSNCELGEWRSVLIQVHAPDNPPRPIPPVDPGWDKYTIRCCSFHTESIVSALLGDLLKGGLDKIPENLRGPVLQAIRKGLGKLIDRLRQVLPKLGSLVQAVTELLELFPAEFIRETGVFELRERDKANPRGMVLCYSGLGLRVLFPREKLDDLIDGALDKIPGTKLLPDAVRKQIKDSIRNAIPSALKTLVQPIESDMPGSTARFDLAHPRNFGVFKGGVQIGKAFWMPGQVNVEFDSPPWRRPDPVQRPRIVSCPDTDCNDAGVQAVVGNGQGLELFSISQGDLKPGSCVCAVASLATQQEATMVEAADQIVRQDSGRLSAVELLGETLEQTGCNLWAVGSERVPSAAEIFDAFAYRRSGGPREQVEGCFEVVAWPGSTLQQDLRRFDVLVRRGDGDMGHIAIIASAQLKTLESLLAEGLIPETFSAGLYAQVIETGTRPHELADKFARLITEPNGRVPGSQLILRPRSSLLTQWTQTGRAAGNGSPRRQDTGPRIESEAVLESEGVGRLIDDLLLLRLATPTPPTVVTVAAPQAAAPPPATTGSDATEGYALEDDTTCNYIDPAGLSWPGASDQQMDLMRRVYLRQVSASCQVRRFISDIPDSDLSEIESGVRARTAAANTCQALLSAARAARAGDPAAANVSSIGVVSGYRSASHQFANWTRAFPTYYNETQAQRAAASGGEFGDAAATLLARYISGRLAAPGFSLHNDGQAIDFSTVQGGISMGASTSARNRANWRRSWFFGWLTANANDYGFFQNTSIDEPWHWEFRGLRTATQSSDFAPDTTAPTDQLVVDMGESTIAAGRCEQVNTPLLTTHRGTQPDLILRWNDMVDPSALDIVVHFHGYSSDRENMSLRRKEAYSGLDFGDPEAPGATAGRRAPTLCILPRGSYTGNQPGANPERYTFPALIRSAAVNDLIIYSTAQFQSVSGAPALPRGRLILTAHSGAGAGLMGLLANNAPDEIHTFDALYSDSTPLINWISARIAAELQSWTPGKSRADGGLCVIYREGRYGTASQSLRVQRAIVAALAGAPSDARALIQSAYRVLRSSVEHIVLPRRYGWLLLADVTQTLPSTRPPAESESAELQAHPAAEGTFRGREYADIAGESQVVRPPTEDERQALVDLAPLTARNTTVSVDDALAIMRAITQFYNMPLRLGWVIMDHECDRTLERGFRHPDGIMQTTRGARQINIRRFPRSLKLTLLGLPHDDTTPDAALNTTLLAEFPRRLAVQIAAGCQELAAGLRSFSNYVALSFIAYNAGAGSASRIVTGGRSDQRPRGVSDSEWEEQCRFGAALLHQPPASVEVEEGNWRCDSNIPAWWQEFRVRDRQSKLLLIAYQYLRSISACIAPRDTSIPCNSANHGIRQHGSGTPSCRQTRDGALDKLYDPTKIRPTFFRAVQTEMPAIDQDELPLRVTGNAQLEKTPLVSTATAA